MALRTFGGNIGGAVATWLVGLAVERLGMWTGFGIVATFMVCFLDRLTMPALVCHWPDVPPSGLQ